MRGKLTTITRRGDPLEMLKKLAVILAEKLETATDEKIVAQLAKQYLDTIGKIAEMEGTNETDDEIGEILSVRSADGKPGAVRKNRS